MLGLLAYSIIFAFIPSAFGSLTSEPKNVQIENENNYQEYRLYNELKNYEDIYWQLYGAEMNNNPIQNMLSEELEDISKNIMGKIVPNMKEPKQAIEKVQKMMDDIKQKVKTAASYQEFLKLSNDKKKLKEELKEYGEYYYKRYRQASVENVKNERKLNCMKYSEFLLDKYSKYTKWNIEKRIKDVERTIDLVVDFDKRFNKFLENNQGVIMDKPTELLERMRLTEQHRRTLAIYYKQYAEKVRELVLEERSWIKIPNIDNHVLDKIKKELKELKTRIIEHGQCMVKISNSKSLQEWEKEVNTKLDEIEKKEKTSVGVVDFDQKFNDFLNGNKQTTSRAEEEKMKEDLKLQHEKTLEIYLEKYRDAAQKYSMVSKKLKNLEDSENIDDTNYQKYVKEELQDELESYQLQVEDLEEAIEHHCQWFDFFYPGKSAVYREEFTNRKIRAMKLASLHPY